MNLTISGKFKLRALARFAAAACLVLLASASTSCESEDDYDLWCTITGNVTDYINGDPLENATVVLTPTGQTVRTDVYGNYEFSDLESRQYVVTVQKSGYQPNRKNVQAVSGESVRADIQLTPIPAE